jgi:hypothetical protein
MSCQIGVNSIFGANNYIRFLNSDLVAIEGPNTLERLIASDVRIPYKQVLKGRIQLKAGQVNYLMNHLGLGDNATFVAIIARYDSKSVNEEDNYLEWYYYDDPGTKHYMDQLMFLTGNSTHRIPQLYITNPNQNYNVQLDVMVAIIDDTYTFFPDTTNQSGLSFYDLQCNSTVNCINTFVTNESIVIYDTNTPRKALVYITNTDISSININGDLIIIDSQTMGKIFLQFISIDDAKQAYSLINWILEVQDVVVQGVNMDLEPPIIYFYPYVNNDNTKSYITMGGMTAGVPYDTGTNSSSLTFSTSFSLSEYGDLVYGSYTITKSGLYNILISGAADNRDGEIRLDDSDLILEDFSCNVISSIAAAGTYSLYFNVNDIAGNYINSNTYILLSVTT